MSLPEGLRQAVAAIVASIVFAALFFGANAVWLVALVLAVAVYGGVLLLVKRRKTLSEIHVASRVTAQELREAATALSGAATSITEAADVVAPDRQRSLIAMAKDLEVIRANILDDPADFRAARSFVNVHLPVVVEVVETYSKLAVQKTPETEARINELGDRIKEFGPPIRQIRNASTEADLSALETQVSVLSQLMDRRRSRL